MNISRGPPGRMGRTAAHLRVDCTGPGLSAVLAAATKIECVLLYLLARLRVEGDLAYRYPAIVAGVGALVLVVILSRWVRVGCARLSGGHEASPSWSGPRGVSPPPGLPTLSTPALSHSRKPGPSVRLLFVGFFWSYDVACLALCW